MFEARYKCKEPGCNYGSMIQTQSRCPVMGAVPNPDCPACGIEMHLIDWRDPEYVSKMRPRRRARKGGFEAEQLRLF